MLNGVKARGDQAYDRGGEFASQAKAIVLPIEELNKFPSFPIAIHQPIMGI